MKGISSDAGTEPARQAWSLLLARAGASFGNYENSCSPVKDKMWGLVGEVGRSVCVCVCLGMLGIWPLSRVVALKGSGNLKGRPLSFKNKNLF